jgi:hypothetical protein
MMVGRYPEEAPVAAKKIARSDVRLYTTETIPAQRGTIIWGQAFFGEAGTLAKALDVLRDLAAKADCRAVVGVRVECILLDYNPLFEKRPFWYLVYGTGVEFDE